MPNGAKKDARPKYDLGRANGSRQSLSATGTGAATSTAATSMIAASLGTIRPTRNNHGSQCGDQQKFLHRKSPCRHERQKLVQVGPRLFESFVVHGLRSPIWVQFKKTSHNANRQRVAS